MGEGVLPPIVLELRAKATELRAELGATKKELSELDHHTSSTSSSMGRAFTKTAGYGKTLAVGMVGVGAAVAGFAVESAMSAEVVDAKLSTAIKNAGGSMEEFEPKISSTDARLRTLGFTNDQTNTALATMTTALHDPAKALGAMGVAADLARSKNIDLNTASLMVAKAMEGQTRPLKALGIDLPVYAGGAQNVKVAQDALATSQLSLTHLMEKYPDAANKSSKAHQAYETATLAVKQATEKLQSTQNAGNTIMAAVESRVKGTAAAYGDTLKGKIASAKAGVEAMGESLGKKLIPIISAAITWAQKFVGWLTDHTPVLYTVAGVIGTVVVTAIAAYIASLVSAAATSVASFATMAAKGAWWVATHVAQIATVIAQWAVYAAQGIAQVVASAATGFASMVASGAAWVASTAAQMAKAVAAGVVWIAQHVAMAAAAVIQYGIIAAAATAAFIAENAATLGIVGLVALLVAAAVWLATHWKQAWGAITDAAKWAYDHVIKPVGDWIVSNVLHPIATGVSWLYGIWKGIWSGIATAAKWAYDNVIGPIARWINSNVIQPIGSGIKTLGSVWSGIWGAISGAVRTAWGIISGIVDSIVGAVRSAKDAVASLGSQAAKAQNSGGLGGLGFKGLGFMGLVPHMASGGWLNMAPKGQPIDMVGHGGEYMLSTQMLEGRQPVDPKVLASLQRQQPSKSELAMTGGGRPAAGAGGQSVTVIATTNASPYRIAADAGWALRAMA